MVEIELVIEVEDLAKSYGKIQALRGVGFKVYSGEVVGYIGPNASGKTTTLKILAGLLKPDYGVIRVFSLDPWKNSLEVKLKLGFLPEKPVLPMKVDVQFLLEKISEIKGISNSKREIIRLARMLEFKEYLNKPIAKLSRGYLQRVALASALIGEPELLLLDEPTANLDPHGRKLLLSYLKELSGKDRTIIISSHILSEVEATCNKLVIIYMGTIVAKGKPKDLALKYKLPVKVLLTGVNLENKVKKIREQSYVRKVALDFKDNIIEVIVEGQNYSEFELLIKNLELKVLMVKPPSIEDIYLKVMENVEVE